MFSHMAQMVTHEHVACMSAHFKQSTSSCCLEIVLPNDINLAASHFRAQLPQLRPNRGPLPEGSRSNSLMPL